MKYCFGVDIGGTTVKLGLFTTEGEIVDKWEIKTRTENQGEAVLPDIAAALNEKLEEKQIPKDEVEGIGVGVPAPVTAEGVVNGSANLGWKYKEAKKELEELTGMKATFGNDANVAALGEMWKGGGAGCKNLVMVTLGTGVGGGVIVGGKIVVGQFGAGGEIGHMCVNYHETKQCGCGSYGCLEQYASATGIVRLATEKLESETRSTLLKKEELSAKAVFDALGAKTYVINNDPDGTNINTNCGSTHIEGLQKFVVEKGLDVGFAYDGDADRCLCVDDKGELVDGDKILYVCGRYMKERGELNKNTIVTTIMSNLGLYKALDKKGISYDKTAVGDKYVFESMMEHGYSIGGEQSGHIIFSKYATTGDGVLTSLKIMEVILERKCKLSECFKSLTIFPQLLVNVKVSSKDAVMNDPDVQALNQKIAEELGSDGRLLLRQSGTEPLIRVMVEAESDELCNKYVYQMVDLIKEKGYAI